jgi:hypothetical protein
MNHTQVQVDIQFKAYDFKVINIYMIYHNKRFNLVKLNEIHQGRYKYR